MTVEPEYNESPATYMSLGEFAKRVLLLGAIIVAGLALWQLRLVLLLTFLAVVIAVSLDIPVTKLQEYGLKRGFATLIVLAAAIALLSLLGVSIGTPVVAQTQNLVEDLPDAVKSANDGYQELTETWLFLPKVDFNALGQNGEDASSLISTDALTGGALLVTSVGSFVASVIINLLLVVIVSVYLLVDPEIYPNSLLALFPKDRQALVLQIMVDLRQALVGWLVSQMFSVTIVTLLIWFALGIWGIPNAIALGLLAGIFTMVPNFGPIIAFIPALIITLAERPDLLVPVIITYIFMQQLEASFLTPMIIKHRLHIPAAALLVFQVMAGILFGFLGLLLAVPLFMVVIVLVRDLYVDYLLDNINTAIESRQSESGETVLRVTSKHYTTQEIPLKQIFNGEGPFDRTLEEVMRTIKRSEQEMPTMDMFDEDQ